MRGGTSWFPNSPHVELGRVERALGGNSVGSGASAGHYRHPVRGDRHGHHDLLYAADHQAGRRLRPDLRRRTHHSPRLPTTLAIVGDAFPRMTGTAIGFVITCGWTGLAVSSSIIGAIAGGDPQRPKKAVLVIPGSAVLMVGVNLIIRANMH